MLLFLLTAEDCGNINKQAPREEKQVDVFQVLESEFLNDDLSSDELQAFEIRAVQKLNDLIDYLNVYADTALASEFRIQSKNMIEKVFYKKDDFGNYLQILSFVEDSVKSKLNYLDETINLRTEIDSVRIIQPLQKKNNSLYSGEVQFYQSIYKTDNSDKVIIKSGRQNLKMVVVKSEKQFGEKTQLVWEIFLAGLH